MKRIILSFLFLVSVACYSQSVADKAREAYDKGDFNAAIELLEAEAKSQSKENSESAELYYNLGNSYFRMNQLGKARLNYERALLIDPSDRDIRHNIDYLTTKMEDKILVADTFFVNSWFRSIQNICTSNTWANVAITSFLILIACLVLFFFSKIIVLKKTAFYIGFVFVVICLFSNVFAYKQKVSVENRNTAVIMTGTAPVHSSPDRNSKDVFTLHEGTKIEIIKEDRSWLEIEIPDGSVGWIQRDKIEII